MCLEKCECLTYTPPLYTVLQLTLTTRVRISPRYTCILSENNNDASTIWWKKHDMSSYFVTVYGYDRHAG